MFFPQGRIHPPLATAVTAVVSAGTLRHWQPRTGVSLAQAELFMLRRRYTRSSLFVCVCGTASTFEVLDARPRKTGVRA